MNYESSIQTAAMYLHTLCIDIPTRPVGSIGNHRATDWFAKTIAEFGFTIEMPQFNCTDWSSEGASLTAGGIIYSAHSSPYALGCDVRAPLTVISTVADLEMAQIKDKIVLLHGEIAREQLMPKNFTFYNPDEHQHIYHLLESQPPAAIITATGHNPNIAGALYPFPLFEDGDFDIPSIYLTDIEGVQIARYAGETVHLVSRTERRPSTGCNVIARKPRKDDRRIVVMAHLDAKDGTPGALDDGGGIVTLLLLAEALKNYAEQHSIEIVAINGEDYYANPGEMDYLHRNEGAFNTITLGINIDGIGYIEGWTAYSLYECSFDLAKTVRAVLAAHPSLYEGEPWYQGDHMLMMMHKRPALALTSERAMELLSNVIHTANDTPALVDPARLVEAAHAVHDVIMQVDKLEV